jgi:hypothetical protein
MKKSFFYIGIGLGFLALLSSCNLPVLGGQDPSSPAVGTAVAQTLQAMGQSNQTDVPALLATPTLGTSLKPSITPVLRPGALEGNIVGYPYGGLAALAIVAYEQNSTIYWYVITSPGNTFYSMTDTSNKGYVSPGKYQVVAYDAAGNSGGCTFLASVVSDQTATCDITDWSSAYRGKPAGVPNP